MAVLFTLTSSIGAWIIATDIPPTSAVQIPGGTFCVPRTANHRFFRFWIPALSYEILLCAMALYISFKTFRATGSFMARSQSLVQVLIRDSVFYFLIISATYIFCMTWWAHAPIGLVEAPIGFSIAMSSVFASRILFHLRDVATSDRTPVYRGSLPRQS
uniref:Uncharacterized protein n=1 Tax=Psilocybe cubensis TaxID=181762 RepID=A0A8H8CH81_PSICU